MTTVCSVHMSVIELSQAKYVTPSFNFKKEYEKLAAVVLVQSLNSPTFF